MTKVIQTSSLVNLAEAEIESALEERQRLARDLHDTVAQTLYSMTLLAEAVRRMANAGDLDQVQAYASRLGETAQQSLKEMRLLVYEMRTSVLEEQGLAKAIQNRLDSVEKRSGINVHFQTNLEGKLPEPLEQGLFYIVSETLTNSLNIEVRFVGACTGSRARQTTLQRRLYRYQLRARLDLFLRGFLGRRERAASSRLYLAKG